MQQGICNPEFYGDLVYKLENHWKSIFKCIVNRLRDTLCGRLHA